MTVLFIFCQKAKNKRGYYFNTGKGRVFLAEWFAGVKADFILNFVKDDRWKLLLNGLGVTPVSYTHLIQDQLYEYEDAIKELERYTDFYYCLVNTRTGNEVSNREAEEIENLKINSFLDGRYTKGKVVYDTEYYYNYTDEGKLVNYFYYDNYLDSVSRILLNSGYTLYAGVSDDVETGNGVFAKQYQAFESRRLNAPRAVMAAAMGAIDVYKRHRLICANPNRKCLICYMLVPLCIRAILRRCLPRRL